MNSESALLGGPKAVQSKLGANIITVSSLFQRSPVPPTDPTKEGYHTSFAKGVKRAIRIPVIGVRGIRTPGFADRMIRKGRVDLVAIGRAVLDDPDWPIKAQKKLGGKDAE